MNRIHFLFVSHPSFFYDWIVFRNLRKLYTFCTSIFLRSSSRAGQYVCTVVQKPFLRYLLLTRRESVVRTVLLHRILLCASSCIVQNIHCTVCQTRSDSTIDPEFGSIQGYNNVVWNRKRW
jgi:hypothetical protein